MSVALLMQQKSAVGFISFCKLKFEIFTFAGSVNVDIYCIAIPYILYYILYYIIFFCKNYSIFTVTDENERLTDMF